MQDKFELMDSKQLTAAMYADGRFVRGNVDSLNGGFSGQVWFDRLNKFEYIKVTDLDTIREYLTLVEKEKLDNASGNFT